MTEQRFRVICAADEQELESKLNYFHRGARVVTIIWRPQHVQVVRGDKQERGPGFVVVLEGGEPQEVPRGFQAVDS